MLQKTHTEREREIFYISWVLLKNQILGCWCCESNQAINFLFKSCCPECKLHLSGMAFFQYAPGARPDLELVCQLVARLVPIKFLIRLKKDDLPCPGTCIYCLCLDEFTESELNFLLSFSLSWCPYKLMIMFFMLINSWPLIIWIIDRDCDWSKTRHNLISSWHFSEVIKDYYTALHC